MGKLYGGGGVEHVSSQWRLRWHARIQLYTSIRGEGEVKLDNWSTLRLCAGTAVGPVIQFD